MRLDNIELRIVVCFDEHVGSDCILSMKCFRTLALFAVIMLMSCEHKELVTTTNCGTAKANVRVDVDWSLFDEETPTGMTVAFFSKDKQKIDFRSTNDVFSYVTQLAPGVYHVGVLSQSPDELDTVEFTGVQSGSMPMIVGKSTSIPSFMPDELKDERVKVEPQIIGYDYVYNLVVPADADTTVVVRLEPRRIDYTVDICVEVTGYSRIQKVYGVLTGMSAGYNAVADEPVNTVASFGVDEWSLSMLNAEEEHGLLKSTLRTFGVAHAEPDNVRDINLKVYLQLSETKITEYTFAVGKCFEKHNNRWYSIYIDTPIEIPASHGSTGNKPPTNNSSGFDATVDGWGDNTELNFE